MLKIVLRSSGALARWVEYTSHRALLEIRNHHPEALLDVNIQLPTELTAKPANPKNSAQLKDHINYFITTETVASLESVHSHGPSEDDVVCPHT